MQDAIRVSRDAPVFFEPAFEFDLGPGSSPASLAPRGQSVRPPAAAPASPAQAGADAALDQGELLRTMGADRAAVRELAGVMREDVALRRRAIGLAVAAREAARVKQHAHALKGAFSAIFAARAAAAAGALEAAMRREDWSAVEQAAATLEQQMERVDRELVQLLAADVPSL